MSAETIPPRKPGAVAQMFERLDALSVKERVLIVGALLLSVAMGWQSLLIDPLVARKQGLLADVESASDALQRLQAVSDELLAAERIDPDAGTRQLLAARGQELHALQTSIEAKVGRVVPPAQVAKVLETVLGRIHDLEFIGLEGLGVEPLVQAADSAKGSARHAAAPAPQPPAHDARTLTPLVAGTPKRPQAAYRHGIRIRFAGSYLATLQYLRALEALPWGFFWDRVELETRDFPRVEGSIVVYTVSLEEGWIGV